MIHVCWPYTVYKSSLLTLWRRHYIHHIFKETLQLILRKILKMRFFPWLSVFLLHRWKYKLSDNNTILKLKITVLSQKLIIFCGLVDKSFLYRDTCAVNVNITSMAYNGENERFADQEILQTLLGKGLKECEI